MTNANATGAATNATLQATMPLLPTDYPTRLANAGLRVKVCDGWQSNGSSADHRAICLHHTASSSSETPDSCANYSFWAADTAPHYNVLITRDACVWVGARGKSNNAGEISGTALDEVLRGQANLRSAAERGLSDTTSANAQLLGVAIQNNGTGETYPQSVVDATAQVCAVTLPLLGCATEKFATTHRSLTARKIDPSGDGLDPECWHREIADAMHGTQPKPPAEVPEMWMQSETCPAGKDRDEPGAVAIGVPYGAKGARVDLYADCPPSEGVSCWAAVNLEGKNHGLWSGGNTWELYIPGRKLTAVSLPASARGVQVHHMGGTNAPLQVTVSGT
jgi:hypothetical protein